MSTFAIRYRLRTDRHGLAVITESGRCTTSDINGIEGSATHRYKMEPLPNASGAILKAMDGSRPRQFSIRPPAFEGRTYRCVKTNGRVNPFAIRQSGGAYDGKVVHSYEMTWQQVGGIA